MRNLNQNLFYFVSEQCSGASEGTPHIVTSYISKNLYCDVAAPSNSLLYDKTDMTMAQLDFIVNKYLLQYDESILVAST